MTDATEAGTLGTGEGGRGRTPLALARGSQIGRYVLLHPIGRGAAGQVWVAHDTDLDRRVAIKILDAVVDADPLRRRRLLAEAQAMAKVRHVNVVAVFDVGTHEDRVYIAMELVEGTTLRAWCSAQPRPRAAIVAAFLAAARGLAAAHAAGVVHRDFKPDNVLVEGDAAHGAGVKVADFGLAQGTADTVATTSDGAGTPAYMSPEHHGRGVVDARSDQFSFCIALFEALWGHRPFRGDTPVEIAAATCDGVLDTTGDAAIPGRLRRVVLQGLARAPEQRHASMDALIEALERATRRRAPRIAAAVVAAAVPVGVWVAVSRTPEVDPCTRGGEIIAEAWGPTERAQVGVIEAGYTPAFVEHANLRLRDALDDYARQWAEHHDEICARHRGVDDPAAEAQRECLEDRRGSFTSLTEVLRAQPIDVASLDAVLADLPLLSTCHSAGLRGWSAVPEEQALRAPVAELRAELRQISIQRRVSKDSPAVIAELEDLLARAEAVGYPHLVASVQAELGHAEIGQGHAQRAAALLDDALVRALANGHERLCAQIIVAMLSLAVRAPSLGIDTDRLGGIAEALVAHSGGDDGLTAALANKRGELHFARGDWRRATQEFERSANAWERAVGPDEPQAARPRLSQAVAFLQLGDTASAERILDTLTPKIRAKLGDGHDIVLQALSLRATLADQNGEWRRAIEFYAQALAQAQAAGGDRRSHISTFAFNIAGTAALHGDIELARRNAALSRAAWPMTGDPLTEGEFLQLEATVSVAAGAYEDAIREADAAVALFAKGEGREHRIASARASRAAALVGLRRYAEALETISAPDWTIDRESHARGTVGVIAATALGDALDAGRWLAYAELVPPDAVTDARAMLRLLMVRTPTPEQRAAGQRHRDDFAASTYPLDPLLAAFDEWLAGRWPPAPGSAFAPLPPIAARASTHADSARKPGVHSVP